MGIDCPHAKSSMTPCIARDGALALADDPQECVGCGNAPQVLLEELAHRYQPAVEATYEPSATHQAYALQRLVAEYVNRPGA